MIYKCVCGSESNTGDAGGQFNCWNCGKSYNIHSANVLVGLRTLQLLETRGGDLVSLAKDLVTGEARLPAMDADIHAWIAAVPERVQEVAEVKMSFSVKMEPGCQGLEPVKKNPGDAGYDLSAARSCIIKPGEIAMISAGFKMALPAGYEAQVRTRSGLGKLGICVSNSPGTIDAGYRGEVCVLLVNHSDKPYTVTRGDRIAQMVINKLPDAEMVMVTELDATARGENGFGSTGK